jgi:hypothetical protein
VFQRGVLTLFSVMSRLFAQYLFSKRKSMFGKKEIL